MASITGVSASGLVGVPLGTPTARVTSSRGGLVPTVLASDSVSQKTLAVADIGIVYDPSLTGATVVYPRSTPLTLTSNDFFITGTGVTPTHVVSSSRAGQVPVVVPQANTGKTYNVADLGALFDNSSTALPNKVGLTSAQLTLNPQAFNTAGLHPLATATLTLTPQAFSIIQPRTVSFTTASLTLNPQAFTAKQAISIAQASLTLTPVGFNATVQLTTATLTLTPQTFGIAHIWPMAQNTLTLTPQAFTWDDTAPGVVISLDQAFLTLGPLPFSISYVPPYLHMTQASLDVAQTQDADLNLTQQGIETAVSGGASDLRQTQQIAEVGVVSQTSWLHQTQEIIEAAASVVNVPFRVGQFAIEVMRGFPTHQGWNADGVIVTPIYPVLPGLGFNVKRSFTSVTTIQPIISGKETRMGEWSQNRYAYELTYELLRDWPTFDEYRLLEQFWLQQIAQMGVFLFTDPDDNTVSGQVLGTGTGKETQFQLRRTIGATGYQGWTDDIHAPNILSAVYVDGVLQDPTTYDLTYWNQNIPGILSLHTAVPDGVVLTADFSYYWPVRFDADTTDFEQFLHNFWENKKIGLTTIKGNNIKLLPDHPYPI